MPDESVIQSVQPGDIVEIFRQMGFGAQIDEDRPNVVHFQVEGMKCGITCYGMEGGASDSLQFWSGFRHEADLRTVNEWNSTRRYLRAYAGDDAIIVDMDVDLSGGVTREFLVEKVRLWRGLYLSILRFFAD